MVFLPEVLMAYCNPKTAEIALKDGKIWTLTRRKLTNNTTATGTLTFNKGTSICQGTITQGLDTSNNGILTETSNDTAPNYRIVFTFDGQDSSGSIKRVIFVLIQPISGSAQAVQILQKPNDTIKITHPGNVSIVEVP